MASKFSIQPVGDEATRLTCLAARNKIGASLPRLLQVGSWARCVSRRRPTPAPVTRAAANTLLLALALILSGCANLQTTGPANPRPFDFSGDTFAYANELVWKYAYDANGKWMSKRREPPPEYTHHCFGVARSAKQFFLHARFDPTQPAAGEAACRRLIRQVLSRSPRTSTPEESRIMIPGYANLREFSRAHAALLKQECGGAWRSYVQRGHWRMLLPFSRAHQEFTAAQLAESLKLNRPAVVHVVRFPQLSINHAVLLFDSTETETEIRFATYDPNQPDKPATLTYDRASRTFRFPPIDYFVGGPVDVYEIYSGCCY